MKLSITRGGYTITLKSKEQDMSTEDMGYILPKLDNILSDFLGEDNKKSKIDYNIQNINDFISKQENKYESKQEIKKESPIERPLVRERIPNTNVVDIKELDIKKAITENALVRCPHCGQAHAIMVSSGDKMYFMRNNKNKNEFEQVAEFNTLDDSWLDMCYKEETNTKLDYYNIIQNIHISEIQNDFLCDNDTEIFCPVCKISDTFLNWKDAYESPLNFFETEYLCDVCGGEKLSKIIKDKNMYECDSCGYQTEYIER